MFIIIVDKKWLLAACISCCKHLPLAGIVHDECKLALQMLAPQYHARPQSYWENCLDLLSASRLQITLCELSSEYQDHQEKEGWNLA